VPRAQSPGTQWKSVIRCAEDIFAEFCGDRLDGSAREDAHGLRLPSFEERAKRATRNWKQRAERRSREGGRYCGLKLHPLLVAPKRSKALCTGPYGAEFATSS